MTTLSILGRVLATLALVSVATAQETGPNCGPAFVQLRDPPTIGGSSPGWVPPPSGWIFKPWDQVNTSNSQSKMLRNFQWDPTPINEDDLDGPFNDLTTFQLPGNETIFTSYGVTVENSTYVFDYQGTGILVNATSQYSWLGWGCDAYGNEYFVSYATAAPASGTPAGIDIMSTVDTGLDPMTLRMILQGLRQSRSELITSLVDSIEPNIQDGGRRGLGRITECDDKCKTNENLIGIIG